MFKLLKWLCGFNVFHITYVKGVFNERSLFQLKVSLSKSKRVLIDKRKGSKLIIDSLIYGLSLSEFDGVILSKSNDDVFFVFENKEYLKIKDKESTAVSAIPYHPSADMIHQFKIVFSKIIELLKTHVSVSSISLTLSKNEMIFNTHGHVNQITPIDDLEFPQHISLKNIDKWPNVGELYYLVHVFYNLTPPRNTVHFSLGDKATIMFYGQSFSYDLYRGDTIIFHVSNVNREKYNTPLKSYLKTMTSFVNLDEDVLENLHQEIDDVDNLIYVCTMADEFKQISMYDNRCLNNNKFN